MDSRGTSLQVAELTIRLFGSQAAHISVQNETSFFASKFSAVAATPFPDNVTLKCPRAVPSEMLIVPDAAPSATGVNVTDRVQLRCAPKVAGHPEA